MKSPRQPFRYQKMGILKLSATMLLGAVFYASPSFAECTWKSGYIYVWESCTGKDWQNEGSPCHQKDDEPSFKALIISNVIYDKIGNGRYPRSHFYDRTAIKFGDAMNGEVSHCYDTRAEAEDDRDDLIARRKQSSYRIHHIDLRNQ